LTLTVLRHQFFGLLHVAQENVPRERLEPQIQLADLLPVLLDAERVQEVIVLGGLIDIHGTRFVIDGFKHLHRVDLGTAG
jgi:hypothetical protein